MLAMDTQAIQARRLMNVTTMMGMLLLENGAEVYRAEDTMQRICKSQDGIIDVDVLATPGWLFVSYRIDGEPLTKMRRVKSTTINLSKITRLNALSRQITAREITIEQAQERILQIAREKEVDPWITDFGGIVGALAFTYFIGASFIDGICASIATTLMLILLRYLDRFHLSFFISTLAGAFISTAAVLVLYLAGIVTNFDQAIVGSILILFPGVGITNSMRDALSGDFLSGLTHGMKAIATALGIAIGVGMILLFRQEVLGWF